MKKRRKNMKINNTINIVESFALIILLTISLFAYSNIIVIPTIVKTIITVLSFILIGMILSIELFCLMIESNKYRIISIVYYVVDVILLLSLNLLLPFFSLITVLILNIVKNVYRIKNISLIYEYDKFAAYCKIYNIKTRRPRKTSTSKVTKTTTKKVSSKVPTNKKTSKSYA